MLRTVARHSGAWTVLLAGCTTVGAAAQLLLPIALGHAVDAVSHGGLGRWALACAVLAGCLLLGDTLGGYAAAAGTARATAWLRRRLARHTFSLPPQAPLSTGDTVNRMVAGSADAGDAAAALVSGAVAALPPLGAIVLLAVIDWWLAVAFLAALPLITLVLHAFVRDTSGLVVAYQRSQGAISHLLGEALAGARTIAAAGTTDREVRRVLTPLPRLRADGFAMWRVQGRAAGRGALLLPVLEVTVLAVAGLSLTLGRISVGDLLAAARYATLGAGVGSVITLAGQLARARAGARRVTEVLRLPPARHGSRRLPPGPGTLLFRDVSAGPLSGVSLTVPGGHCLAVVGESGAGKSLLAALAGRLADPESGIVALDGVPLPELSATELRAAVGYAFERPALLGETIADVIGYGPGAIEERTVVTAAESAAADGFIRRLPDGYRTAMADAPLSGGEAQRLGLARAFAHDGRLLVLDDATSSLDTVTELQVGHALTARLSGRTRVVVAHRAGTAAAADLVAWLDDGRLRALAPHRQLWRDTDYRAVFGADRVAA